MNDFIKFPLPNGKEIYINPAYIVSFYTKDIEEWDTSTNPPTSTTRPGTILRLMRSDRLEGKEEIHVAVKASDISARIRYGKT